jgi:hypothetical protein
MWSRAKDITKRLREIVKEGLGKPGVFRVKQAWKWATCHVFRSEWAACLHYSHHHFLPPFLRTAILTFLSPSVAAQIFMETILTEKVNAGNRCYHL